MHWLCILHANSVIVSPAYHCCPFAQSAGSPHGSIGGILRTRSGLEAEKCTVGRLPRWSLALTETWVR